MSSGSRKPGANSQRNQREARLEEALRFNLRRRKAQAKARSGDPSRGPDDGLHAHSQPPGTGRDDESHTD